MNPPPKKSPASKALSLEPPAEDPAARGSEIGVEPEEIDRLPSLPGVYLMKDATGKVLYIGKAANLRGRVANYFTRGGEARFNVRYLMRHVRRVETIITSNEKEAFLLENTLIKTQQPRYNIRLRDDKTYVSVRFNLNHRWPRAVVMRRRHEDRRDGALYLGPYDSAGSVRETLRLLQRVFPIRSCKDSVLNNRTRPCLLHSIGRCCAPCVKTVDQGEYEAMVQNTIKVLKGRPEEVISQLRAQMDTHSEDMNYEQAAAVRDRIAAIERTTERQRVHTHDGMDRDVIVIERAGGRVAFAVFVYRNGLLTHSRPFIMKDHDRPEVDLIGEFIGLYYEGETPPREVLIDPMPARAKLLAAWLTERRAAKSEIHRPQRGEKLRMIEVARENCRLLLEQHLSGRKSLEEINETIAGKFHLDRLPDPIECYDISTIQGFATVGSMVTFRKGEPDKSRYRKFRIKTVTGQDDFASLREMLTRRFKKAVQGDDMLPGLVVIDGGKGQLGVAVEVFAELGITDVGLVGMAKARVKRRVTRRAERPAKSLGESPAESLAKSPGDKVIRPVIQTEERTEERFFLPGRKNPVKFAANSPALYLLVRLRDEAHRFGITYHRELRRKMNLRSSLEELPGVGKVRAKILLRAFGSLRRLREAKEAEISAVPGIPVEIARVVYEFLNSGGDL